MNTADSHNSANFRLLLQLLELERRKYDKVLGAREVGVAFDLLLKHLSKLSAQEIEDIFKPTKAQPKRPRIKIPSPDELRNMSLEEVELLLADANTPRKLLEEVAVLRFHFPRGSLRSLANIEILKEKLGVRAQNERTHRTISTVAQSSNSK
ncbi:hypothetical protein ACJMQP_25480 [Rhodopseudomonas palustris]